MRGIIIVLFMLMVYGVATPVWAVEESKTLFLQEATTASTGNGTPMPVHPYTSVSVQVTISATGTVIFEASSDGTTYAAKLCTLTTDASTASSVEATGTYQCNIAGLALFRARITANTGTITVFARASTAMFSGGGGGTTGWPTSSTTKTITWANSLASAVRIGDGVTPGCFFTDATLGFWGRPCTAANTKTVILNGFTHALYDEEGALDMEVYDPDAASTLAMWSYPNAAYRPKKSVWFGAGALSTDGTQCAAPAEVTINSGPKIWTIICTDNDASTIHGAVKMPDNWDAGTVTFDHVYIQTAADTGVLNGDIAAQCRGNGEAPTSTYGTEVAIDDAAVVGSNSNDMTTSAAVTPTGTCAAGDMLYWRYQLDATGTTTAVATLHHVGFKMEYSVVSRSQ